MAHMTLRCQCLGSKGELCRIGWVKLQVKLLICWSCSRKRLTIELPQATILDSAKLDARASDSSYDMPKLASWRIMGKLCALEEVQSSEVSQPSV